MNRRRFIAGAVCPECRAQDRLVVEQRGSERRQLCVECGFERLEQPGSSLPRGRLDGNTENPVEADAVRILEVRTTAPKNPSTR